MRKRILFKSALATAAMMLPLFLSFGPAQAAVTARDVLIKAPGASSAVYYLAQDGKRYVFPNQKTFATWFSDFSSVELVSSADLMSFPLGGNVTYRPGIKMVKITTDPKVYVVAGGGVLRWITSEAVATALYGSDWNKKIDDVPDSFFVNYTIGTPVYASSDYTPQTESDDTDTINDDKHIAKAKHSERSDTKPEIPGYPLPHTACAWRCTDWTDCVSGATSQTRTCSTGSECMGVAGPKPQETQSCTTTTPPAPPPPVPQTDSDTSAGMVIGGSDSALAKFRLFASYEDLKLTKASFTVATPSAVTSLSLYDGAALVGGPVSVSAAGDAFFTGLNFIVPRNGYKDLIVRGMINTVGPTGTPSGGNAKVTMKTTSGSYVFEMTGVSAGSSTLITAIPGGDIVGNDKIVRKTVPTAALTALPTTVLAAGDQVIMRVTVAANAAADVSLKAVTVNVSKSNEVGINPTGDSSHGTIRVLGGSTNLAGHSTASAGCAAAAGTACTLRTAFDTEEVIAAGTSKTYDVLVTVGGTVATGDSISSELDGDSTLLTGGLATGSQPDQVKVNAADVDFAWSDNSAVPHSAAIGSSSADWASGMYVKMLPTDTQTLVK